MLVSKALAVNITDVYAPAKALGGDATISTLANPIITNVLIISGIVAFGVILLAGFSFITASGDKNKTAQASQTLTYGIIGLVLVAAAYLLTRLIGAILGVKLI